MSDDEKKIFIDEDWKAQVERERAELEQKAAAEQELPPASLTLFDNLVAMLASQTAMALGLMVPEGQETVMVDLEFARQNIDILQMLKEKTEGHLNEDESGNLDEAIRELERVFAIRLQQARESQMNQPGINPNPPILDT